MTIERMNYPDGYFPEEEYLARWEKVQAEMRRCQYEVAIVWGKTAGHYERAMETLWLTNFWSEHSGQEPDSPIWNARGFCCVILQAGKSPELRADVAEIRRSLVRCGDYQFSDDPIGSLARSLNRLKPQASVVFVGSDCLPVKYAKQLEALTPDIRYHYDDDLIRRCRRIKSPRELDLFREAGAMVSSALYRVCDSLYFGKTCAEAAAEGAHELARRGGGWLRIPINYGQDADSRFFERDPMYGYSQQAPKRGDMLRTWIYGPVHQGYWIDPGRSLVCGGKPTPAQRSLLEDSYAITEAVMKAAKHGVPILQAAIAAEEVQKRVADEDDLASSQWPYFGHSNGCMWEAPIISRNTVQPDECFEAGMVCSGESFMTRAGIGSVGWEQNFIVTQDGIELLTTTPVFWF